MKNKKILDRLQEIEKTIESKYTKKYLTDEQRIDSDSLKREYNKLIGKLKRFQVALEYESPQDIIDLMIIRFNVPKDFSESKCRKRYDYVYPRHWTMVLSKHIFSDWTLRQIGSYFTNGDHSTVLHALRTVKNLYQTNKQYREHFDEIQKYFLGEVEIEFEN